MQVNTFFVAMATLPTFIIHLNDELAGAVHLLKKKHFKVETAKWIV